MSGILSMFFSVLIATIAMLFIVVPPVLFLSYFIFCKVNLIFFNKKCTLNF